MSICHNKYNKKGENMSHFHIMAISKEEREKYLKVKVRNEFVILHLGLQCEKEIKKQKNKKVLRFLLTHVTQKSIITAKSRVYII